MNNHLKQMMLDHGLHKHISEDCQHRMEMLYNLIIEECIEVIHKQDHFPPGYFYGKNARIYETALKIHFGLQ